MNEWCSDHPWMTFILIVMAINALVVIAGARRAAVREREETKRDEAFWKRQ